LSAPLNLVTHTISVTTSEESPQQYAVTFLHLTQVISQNTLREMDIISPYFQPLARPLMLSFSVSEFYCFILVTFCAIVILNINIVLISSVASTKETTLIGRISDVVRPERGTDFVA